MYIQKTALCKEAQSISKITKKKKKRKAKTEASSYSPFLYMQNNTT